MQTWCQDRNHSAVTIMSTEETLPSDLVNENSKNNANRNGTAPNPIAKHSRLARKPGTTGTFKLQWAYFLGEESGFSSGEVSSIFSFRKLTFRFFNSVFTFFQTFALFFSKKSIWCYFEFYHFGYKDFCLFLKAFC